MINITLEEELQQILTNLYSRAEATIIENGGHYAKTEAELSALQKEFIENNPICNDFHAVIADTDGVTVYGFDFEEETLLPINITKINNYDNE